MNTLPSISAPAFRVNPTPGDPQQDLLKERRSSDEMRLEFDNRSRRELNEPVLRGEWLESVVNQNRYQPLYSRNIDPQNRAAIASYQSAEALGPESNSLGRLIDRYI